MHMKARMSGKPGLHLGMLVCGIVITDEMKLFVFWCFAVDLAEERQPLRMAVALLALADDLTVQHAQGGKQGCGAVTLVIMGHRAHPALFDRQSWLGPIKRLYLALLVAAQHQRVLRGIQIEPHDVLELLGKQGIA